MQLIFLYMLICVRAITAETDVDAKQLNGKILNGVEADIENVKHQVSIRKKASDQFYFGTGHICGGSLIAPNVVLSAAHCFVDYDDPLLSGYFLNSSNFVVVMGTLNRFKKNDNTLTFQIDKLILGVDQFNLNTYHFDVAILILSGSVPINHPTVRIIPLNTKQITNGTMCQVTGWGRTELGVTSAVLMSVSVPLLSNEFCLENSYIPESNLLPGMFCAGYVFTGTYDSCQGDSGGPLVCHKNLTGIVSWGSSCGEPRSPGVYTDVRYYVPWIAENLLKNNINLSNYDSTEYYSCSHNISSNYLSLILILVLMHKTFDCLLN